MPSLRRAAVEGSQPGRSLMRGEEERKALARATGTSGVPVGGRV